MRTRDLLNLIFEAWEDFLRHHRIPHNGWSIRGAHDAMQHMGDLARDTCLVEEVVIVTKKELAQMVEEGAITLEVASPNTLLHQISWGSSGNFDIGRMG